MADITEAQRLALIARLQTQLVNEQADELEGPEHHGHSRRYLRPLHTATILQFSRRVRS